MNSADKFWIAWCPTGAKSPRHRHLSQSSAEHEAVRLAKLYPGHEFFAMGAETSARVQGMTRRVFIDPNEIPF